MRKTIEVAALLAIVNKRNRLSTCDPKVRQGWNDLLETVLHACELYEGFTYLRENEVPKGQLPGIVFHNPVSEKMGSENEHDEFPDETRRVYFIHPSLQDDYEKFREV